MTKAEAHAIFESTSRALRKLQNEIPFTIGANIPQDEKNKLILEKILEAASEIERVHGMANSEMD